jgi:hypothetical protein
MRRFDLSRDESSFAGRPLARLRFGYLCTALWRGSLGDCCPRPQSCCGCTLAKPLSTAQLGRSMLSLPSSTSLSIQCARWTTGSSLYLNHIPTSDCVFDDLVKWLPRLATVFSPLKRYKYVSCSLLLTFFLWSSKNRMACVPTCHVKIA